jgi:hypothetical protein
LFVNIFVLKRENKRKKQKVLSNSKMFVVFFVLQRKMRLLKKHVKKPDDAKTVIDTTT